MTFSPFDHEVWMTDTGFNDFEYLHDEMENEADKWESALETTMDENDWNNVEIRWTELDDLDNI